MTIRELSLPKARRQRPRLAGGESRGLLSRRGRQDLSPPPPRPPAGPPPSRRSDLRPLRPPRRAAGPPRRRLTARRDPTRAAPPPLAVAEPGLCPPNSPSRHPLRQRTGRRGSLFPARPDHALSSGVGLPLRGTTFLPRRDYICGSIGAGGAHDMAVAAAAARLS